MFAPQIIIAEGDKRWSRGEGPRHVEGHKGRRRRHHRLNAGVSYFACANVSSKRPVARTRVCQRPIRWEVTTREKTNAQDESRVVKKSKARGGSSNQSLLERNTIPLHLHGRCKGRRESYAIVRWRTGVFWKCVTKKTVGEARVP